MLGGWEGLRIAGFGGLVGGIRRGLISQGSGLEKGHACESARTHKPPPETNRPTAQPITQPFNHQTNPNTYATDQRRLRSCCTKRCMEKVPIAPSNQLINQLTTNHPPAHTPNRPMQVEELLHPKRCAEKVPIAPSLLKALTIGSATAVALTLLLTCALPRKKKSKAI